MPAPRALCPAVCTIYRHWQSGLQCVRPWYRLLKRLPFRYEVSSEGPPQRRRMNGGQEAGYRSDKCRSTNTGHASCRRCTVSNQMVSSSSTRPGSGGARRRSMSWLQDAVDRVRDFAYAERPPSHDPAKSPKIGLALGGGFARGVAHIGVLHALEQNHVPIDFIAGTSAGALAGIAYATGLPFEEIVKKAESLRFGAFGHWSFSRMGLASNQRLEFYPERFLGVSTFEELKIPLIVTSTDLATGESVYFREGRLGPALRASCAYPGLFRPVEHDGKLLVDGFVSATVP